MFVKFVFRYVNSYGRLSECQPSPYKPEPGLKPMIDVFSIMGRKNLFLRRRRVRNRFCATISLVRNLSNHFKRPMLNLNSFLGTAPGGGKENLIRYGIEDGRKAVQKERFPNIHMYCMTRHSRISLYFRNCSRSIILQPILA